MIYIYTGAIQSGKTTRLGQWLKSHPEADGLLAPIVQGKRCLKRILTTEARCLQPPLNEGDCVEVGRFKFSARAFKWGNEQLLQTSAAWIIIDEVGKLELKGQGLEPAVSRLLQRPPQNLILVVRDTLLEKVIRHYHLDKAGYELFRI